MEHIINIPIVGVSGWLSLLNIQLLTLAHSLGIMGLSMNSLSPSPSAHPCPLDPVHAHFLSLSKKIPHDGDRENMFMKW